MCPGRRGPLLSCLTDHATSCHEDEGLRALIMIHFSPLPRCGLQPFLHCSAAVRVLSTPFLADMSGFPLHFASCLHIFLQLLVGG